MKKMNKETSKTGGLAWLFQRISAVILFILLMLHFVTYHFIGKGVVKYDDIITKMKSPWFSLIQFLFLITALYHGLNGIWMVAEDYIHSKYLRITFFCMIITVGSALFFIGLLTIFKVANIE